MKWWPFGLVTLLLALERYTRRIVRAADATPPAGRLVSLPSGPVHVLEAGEGPPVVLIHGSDGVVGDWPLCGLTTRLARFSQVVAHDRPGHGHTPVPPGETVTVDLNVRVLRELLGALGVERPVLVGHSYGASVCLAYARAHPGDVAGLVLLAPTAFPKGSLANPMAFALLVPGLRELLTRVLLLPVGWIMMRVEGGKAFFPNPMPRAWERMMLTFSRRPSQATALAQENRSIMGELRRLSAHYADVTVPAVVVAGRLDRLTAYEHHAAPLARALPNARLVTVEGGGHEVHWSHPELVEAAVRALLPCAASRSEVTAREG